MSELVADSALSLSGMTRIVNRLEAEGLVQRVKCTEDGRGYNAVLTYAGLARLRQASPTYLSSIRRHVVDHLDDMDLPALAQALEYFATDAGWPTASPSGRVRPLPEGRRERVRH